MPSARQQLRAMLQGGETIAAPGAYDPLSARVVQSLGFRAIYTGGYMTGAHTAITEPLLTLTEQVDVAKKVVHTTDLPVITDAGAGYGDPLHVMRCVREFEAAGLAAIHLEDQVYPKCASYHKGLEHIVPMDEFVERMTYALQARRDPDFLI
jgi:methylisocitrate lyase